MAEPGRPLTGVLDRVLVGLAVLSIGAFLVHETYSLDIWWQVVVGRDILATASIPRVDHYGLAAMGGSYHDAHWIFQVAVALCDRLGGIAATQLVTVALWSLALYFCYRACRFWTHPAGSAVLVFLAAMACVERFLPRPEIVSLAMIAIYYDLLQRGRFRSPGQLLRLCGLQIVWTNAHGLFVIGPFLVGCYCVGALVHRREERGVASNELPWLASLSGLLLLATLVTPYGLDAWRYAWLMVTQVSDSAPTLFRSLGELSPTFGPAARSGTAFWFYLGLVGIASGSCLWALRHRRLPLARSSIALGMLAASLTGRRNIVLFALVAAPLVAECIAPLLRKMGRHRRGVLIVIAVSMMAWTALPLSGNWYRLMDIPARTGIGVTPSFFPHALPAFLDRIGFTGHVLNSNALGGFYLYHGFPKRIPLLDGRWVTVEPRLLEWIDVNSRDPVRWREVVERFGIRGVLVGHTTSESFSLLPALARAGDWRLVYYDAAASFWLSEEDGEVEAVNLSDLGSLPPLVRVEDGFLLEHFYRAMGASALRMANLERMIAKGHSRETLLARLGILQIERQLWEEAERSFVELQRIAPQSVIALDELAFLAYRRGEAGKAVELLQRAIELAPDNPRLRENLDRVRSRSDVGSSDAQP